MLTTDPSVPDQQAGPGRQPHCLRHTARFSPFLAFDGWQQKIHDLEVFVRGRGQEGQRLFLSLLHFGGWVGNRKSFEVCTSMVFYRSIFANALALLVGELLVAHQQTRGRVGSVTSQESLIHIYQLFVDHVIKNPLYHLGDDLHKCPAADPDEAIWVRPIKGESESG